MSSIEVRPFRRSDREQVAALVKGHGAAVVPGASVSVSSVLSHLERDPGEFIVDPWVRERATLVAEQRGRVVAAAHLLRYRDGQDVGEYYRGTGEIRWFLFWPRAPFWPDSEAGADVLLAACLAQLGRWQVVRQYADGALPMPGVYGVPEQWPHVRIAYERAGFTPEGQVEIVLVADVEALRRTGPDGVPELVLQRSVGINGTRLTALASGNELAGYVEVETLEDAGRLPRNGGFADIGNLEVAAGYRRRGVGSWLVARAADWLRLARVECLLAYALPEEEEEWFAFLTRVGFLELTRTQRGWVRAPSPR